MNAKPEVLAIIPARGGSKGIHQKNLALLEGHPLIYYTIHAAQQSMLISRILLSTDDHDILDFGKKHGIETPFFRPTELALDETPALPVIQHALNFLSNEENYKPDIVILLQPTSPLRCENDIDASIELFAKYDCDSVVSVIAAPHNFNPISIMRLEDGFLKPFLETEKPVLQRQQKPEVYARNGPAILASSYETLMKKNTLYGKRCAPYVMSIEDSVDIDTQFDLELASWLMQRKLALKENKNV